MLSAAQPSSHSFQYQLLPSAFKIAESPTYTCWKIFNLAEPLWNRETKSDYEKYKNRTIAVLIGSAGFFGGMVAMPITLCLAPLTLIADIIVGIAECIFCIYHGLKKDDIFLIAHRKFIVSPCQHLTFCLGVITGGGISWLAFSYPFFLWTVCYALGQVAVGKLPNSLNHHSLNIFIGGGSGEGPNERRKWLEGGNEPSENRAPSKEDPKKSTWSNSVDQAIPLLSGINDAGLSPQYILFKQRLLRKCTPLELLELPANYTQADLKSKFRVLAVLLHPDKNLPRQKEAHALFTILQKAQEILNH